MTQWIVAVFAVIGAFLAGGVAGSVALELLGYWDLPGGGLLAAFSVVCVAYLAAPTRKFESSALCLALGAALAWYLVGDAHYPESYGERAYQPTQLPFAATCLGGFLGLLTVEIFEIWNRARGAQQMQTDAASQRR